MELSSKGQTGPWGRWGGTAAQMQQSGQVRLGAEELGVTVRGSISLPLGLRLPSVYLVREVLAEGVSFQKAASLFFLQPAFLRNLSI